MTNRIAVLISSALFLTLITPFIALSGIKALKTTTITGYVYIVKKNEEGQPIAIGIMVDKEYEIDCYHIEDAKKTQELIKYISQPIQVSGVVFKDKNGKKIIKIKSWKPMSI